MAPRQGCISPWVSSRKDVLPSLQQDFIDTLQQKCAFKVKFDENTMRFSVFLSHFLQIDFIA